jgi:hypothetical protein
MDLSKAPKASKRLEGNVPENWREHHKCPEFLPLDEKGRCQFCQWNAEDGQAGSRGFEVIPFDVPGVYDPKGEPNVLIRKRV